MVVRARRPILRKHQFRWRMLDGTQRKRSFATARARDAFAREVVDAKASGRDWRPEGAAQACRLGDMMVAYVEHSARTKSARTTQNRREALALFGDWLASRFGREDIGPEVLSRPLLESYDQHLVARRYRVSSRRVVHGILHGFWSWCSDREEWEAFVPRPKRIELPAPMLASVHAPTWPMADRMIAELECEVMRRAAVLQRMLGLRLGQVLRLEADDFDLGADQVTVRAELGKTRREKTGRVLPLPLALREELASWRLKPGRIIQRTPGAVRRAFEAAWQAAGIAEVYWRGRPSHALRKAFRSELRALRIPSDAIEYWCGRRTGGQTDDYTDPRALELGALARAIAPLAPRAQGAPLMRLLFPEAA